MPTHSASLHVETTSASLEAREKPSSFSNSSSTLPRPSLYQCNKENIAPTLQIPYMELTEIVEQVMSKKSVDTSATIIFNMYYAMMNDSVEQVENALSLKKFWLEHVSMRHLVDLYVIAPSFQDMLLSWLADNDEIGRFVEVLHCKTIQQEMNDYLLKSFNKALKKDLLYDLQTRKHFSLAEALSIWAESDNLLYFNGTLEFILETSKLDGCLAKRLWKNLRYRRAQRYILITFARMPKEAVDFIKVQDWIMTLAEKGQIEVEANGKQVNFDDLKVFLESHAVDLNRMKFLVDLALLLSSKGAPLKFQEFLLTLLFENVYSLDAIKVLCAESDKISSIILAIPSLPQNLLSKINCFYQLLFDSSSYYKSAVNYQARIKVLISSYLSSKDLDVTKVIALLNEFSMTERVLHLFTPLIEYHLLHLSQTSFNVVPIVYNLKMLLTLFSIDQVVMKPSKYTCLLSSNLDGNDSLKCLNEIGFASFIKIFNVEIDASFLSSLLFAFDGTLEGHDVLAIFELFHWHFASGECAPKWPLVFYKKLFSLLKEPSLYFMDCLKRIPYGFHESFIASLYEIKIDSALFHLIHDDLNMVFLDTFVGSSVEAFQKALNVDKIEVSKMSSLKKHFMKNQNMHFNPLLINFAIENCDLDAKAFQKILSIISKNKSLSHLLATVILKYFSLFLQLSADQQDKVLLFLYQNDMMSPQLHSLIKHKASINGPLGLECSMFSSFLLSASSVKIDSCKNYFFHRIIQPSMTVDYRNFILLNQKKNLSSSAASLCLNAIKMSNIDFFTSCINLFQIDAHKIISTLYSHVKSGQITLFTPLLMAIIKSSNQSLIDSFNKRFILFLPLIVFNSAELSFLKSSLIPLPGNLDIFRILERFTI